MKMANTGGVGEKSTNMGHGEEKSDPCSSVLGSTEWTRITRAMLHEVSAHGSSAWGVLGKSDPC